MGAKRNAAEIMLGLVVSDTDVKRTLNSAAILDGLVT